MIEHYIKNQELVFVKFQVFISIMNLILRKCFMKYFFLLITFLYYFLFNPRIIIIIKFKKKSFVASSRHGQQDELPNGIKGAEVLMTFSIDVDRCLEYFFSMFLQNGGRVTQKMVIILFILYLFFI